MQSTKKSHVVNITGHEALYLKSLVERQVRLQVKLRDGELLSGVLEYFDDNILRLTREHEANLFIYKHHVQTIREQDRRRNPVVRNTAA